MLQQLRQRLGRKQTRKIQRSRLHRIEALEDRRVLATLMVTDAGDAGPGTLRRAVQQANALQGEDTIEFATSLDGLTIQLTSGPIKIQDAVYIDASDLDNLTIDASALDPTPDVVDGQGDRVFDITAPSFISGLTIRGGDIVGDGAGIRTDSSLYLVDSTLEDNHAFGDGSALFVDFTYQYGVVEIYGSQIINNGHLGEFDHGGQIEEGPQARGGGIAVNFGYNKFRGGNRLTIGSSVISGNGSAEDDGVAITGGGLFATGYGSVSIYDSTIEDNAARDSGGGGIAAFLSGGNFYLGYSVVSNNQVTMTENAQNLNRGNGNLGGGGVELSLNSSSATIVDSTISGNTAVGRGGGISVSARDYASASIRRVAVYDNETILPEYHYYSGSRGRYSADGGGAWLSADYSAIDVQNSTFSGNLSGSDGGGIYAQANTYLGEDTGIRVNTSTIANNTATLNQQRGFSAGGGLSVVNGYENFGFELQNSIIAGNRIVNNVEMYEYPNDAAGSFYASYNLIQNPYGDLNLSGSDNLLGYDPQLSPLADNGGNTMTHALAHGSPAIDAGEMYYTGSYDQRGEGYARVLDGTGNETAVVDMGAFERQPGDNIAPVADAGGNINTATFSSNTLDGSGSFDEDNGRDPLSYLWEVVSGSQTAVINSETSEFAEFVAFDPGTYEVRLTVDDGIDTNQDMITIEVVENSAPVADPSLSDTAADINFPIILDGSNSFDADSDPLAYAWSVFSQPVGSTFSIGDDAAEITSAFADTPGVYNVELVVNDGFQNSDPVSFDIFISDPNNNSAPVADLSLSETSGLASSPIAMDASLSLDVDLDPLTYAWSVINQPVFSTALFGDPSAEVTTLSANLPGAYEVRLVVNDGIVDSDPVTMLVTVDENLNPIAAVSPSESSGVAGIPIHLDGSLSFDPEGEELGFQWSIILQPAGSSFEIDDATAPVTTWTADTAGSYRVQLIVDDGALFSEPRFFLTQVAENQLPVADVSGSDTMATVDFAAALDGTGSFDPEMQALSFDWQLVDKPTGSNAVIDDPTVIATSWTADTIGSYQLQLVVNDGFQDSIATTLDVEVVANQAPTADPALSDTAGTVDLAMLLDASMSSDPELEALTYQWQVIAQPGGSSFLIDDPTAEITTWTADTAGTYTVELIVNDGTQNSVPANFDVQVGENLAPTASVSLSMNNGVMGRPIHLNATRSTDPEAQELTYRWSIISRPPGSSTVIDDAAAAQTTWVADMVGFYRVQLIVNDGVQNSAPVTFLTEVTADGRPTANVSLSENSGSVDRPIILNGTRSSDPEMQPLTYRWSVVVVPIGGTAIIANPTAAATTWTADTAGIYRLQSTLR